MSATQRVLVIGDIHGEFEKLVAVLRKADLVDEACSWCGSTATVWFMGDFLIVDLMALPWLILSCACNRKLKLLAGGFTPCWAITRSRY